MKRSLAKTFEVNFLYFKVFDRFQAGEVAFFMVMTSFVGILLNKYSCI